MDRQKRDELERKAALALHDAEDQIMNGEYSEAMDNLSLAFNALSELGGVDRGPISLYE